MFATDLRLLNAVPEETIVKRPLALAPTNGYLQQQPVVIAQNILAYLDNRSATRLLTSCRHFMVLSCAHLLYAPLLKSYFPDSYPSLAAKVSKQPVAQHGLLWYRLYAMIHGGDSSPRVLCGHTNKVTCLAQLADGRIASGSFDNTVRIWPLDRSPSTVSTVLRGHKDGEVRCLAQLADGHIASGAWDNSVGIWPLDSLPPTVLRWDKHGKVCCLAQLTDGRFASGSEDHTVRIWPLDGSPPTVLTGHTDVVNCLTQLVDGRIASGSRDGTVRIWPLDGSPPTILTGHTGWVRCLAQLTDGRIASGSEDRTVRIWPLDGSPPTILTGHTGGVRCLAQLADGRIASGSFDHTVRIWGKDPAILFQRALHPRAVTARPQGRRFNLQTTRRLAILAKAITIMKKAATQ